MNGPSCFYGNVPLQSMKFRAKFPKLFKKHRFTARDHNVLRPPFRSRRDDCIDGARIPFWLPGRIAGVAKPASQVAATGANKHAGGPRKSTFPLDAMENF